MKQTGLHGGSGTFPSSFLHFLTDLCELLCQQIVQTCQWPNIVDEAMSSQWCWPNYRKALPISCPCISVFSWGFLGVVGHTDKIMKRWSEASESAASKLDYFGKCSNPKRATKEREAAQACLIHLVWSLKEPHSKTCGMSTFQETLKNYTRLLLVKSNGL